jgi:hypothetical protein
MLNSKTCYNSLLAQKVIEGLDKRNIEGVYCETKEEAVKNALEMIPKDSLVSCGSSATLREIGLLTTLKNDYCTNRRTGEH